MKKASVILALLAAGFPVNLPAKSLADLRIGNAGLGFQYTGSVETRAQSGDQSRDSSTSLGGITFSLRKQGFRFLNDHARFAWDTSLLISPYSLGLENPSGSGEWMLRGSLFNLRTGPSVEFPIAGEWLLRVHAGIDAGYVATRLRATGSNSSGSGEWLFGYHAEGALLYSPHRNITFFAGGGFENLGTQEITQSSDRALIDLSSNLILSTGMIFPW